MGRVETAEGFCTGTLISSDTVLTAAHCLFDAQGAPHPAEAITFRAGFANGVSVADRLVADWRAAPGYRDTGGTELSAAAIRNDVALLRLARPVPRAEVVPVALHSGLLRDDAVRVVSYGQRADGRLSRPKACSVKKRFADGVMEFDCDIGLGASGAPVLAGRDGRLSILSVVSALARGGDGEKRAYGTTLPGHVAMLRAALRRGEDAETEGKRLKVGQRSEGGARFIRP